MCCSNQCLSINPMLGLLTLHALVSKHNHFKFHHVSVVNFITKLLFSYSVLCHCIFQPECNKLYFRLTHVHSNYTMCQSSHKVNFQTPINPIHMFLSVRGAQDCLEKTYSQEKAMKNPCRKEQTRNICSFVLCCVCYIWT